MPGSYTISSANRTFGRFKEPDDAGSYILKKKAKATFCGANNCTPSTTVNTQGNLLLLRNSNALKYYNCFQNFNKANLNINLLTKLDLTNVNVMNIVSNYFSINYGLFVRFIIDPSGQLFGITPCGLNNFTHYMVYNPPSYSDEIIIT
jgi:hypothetical protein